MQPSTWQVAVGVGLPGAPTAGRLLWQLTCTADEALHLGRKGGVAGPVAAGVVRIGALLSWITPGRSNFSVLLTCTMLVLSSALTVLLNSPAMTRFEVHLVMSRTTSTASCTISTMQAQQRVNVCSTSE